MSPASRTCERVPPPLAQQMDKFSLIRGFRHHNSDHGAADHYVLTGYFPQAGFNPSVSPNNQRPAHGSIIARKLGPRGGVPPYVCLPKMHPSCGPAYLGSTVAPFVIDADPNAPNFSVPDIVPPPPEPRTASIHTPGCCGSLAATSNPWRRRPIKMPARSATSSVRPST